MMTLTRRLHVPSLKRTILVLGRSHGVGPSQYFGTSRLRSPGSFELVPRRPLRVETLAARASLGAETLVLSHPSFPR